jgi:hypothetical protein
MSSSIRRRSHNRSRAGADHDGGAARRARGAGQAGDAVLEEASHEAAGNPRLSRVPPCRQGGGNYCERWLFTINRVRDYPVATQNEAEYHEVLEKHFSSYMPYYPLIAATVAISFDVGCFYAIDISLFTLFSLSEHIVFALEALPIALAILLVGTIIIPAMFSRFQPNKPPTTASPKWYQKVIAIVIVVILLGALISFVFYAIYDLWRTSPALVLIILFLILPIIGAFIIDPRFRQLYIGVSVISTCIFLSFSLGLAFGAGLTTNLNQTNTVNLKNKPLINGRIIRSGERGVLVYERQTNLVRFVPWETIGSIETTPSRLQ